MIEFKKFFWHKPALWFGLFLLVLIYALSANAVTLLMVPGGGTGAGTFTAGGILQGDGTGAIQSNIMSGDGTLSASGVLTVSADAVETITVEGKATEVIAMGKAVYISGAVGNNVQFSLADNTVAGKNYVAGVAIESKTAGQTIRVRHVGQLNNFDTSAWADGDNLYLSTAGSLINTVPTSGTTLHVAYVEYSHASLGDILLHICGEKNIGAPASTDLYIRMGDNAGANKLSYRDYANNEVANIDSDGNIYFGGSVGIGVAAPSQLLHMQGNGTAAQGWARFGLSSTEYTEIGHKGNNSAINAVGDGDLDFRHDSVTKASLSDAGVLTATTFTGALSGNATTATALAANGANCAVGNYPLGVNASGAVESCTPIGGGGDITDVFNCSTGDCSTVALGTGEWLVYGNGFIDANRFGGVVTVSGTEFSYLNNVTSAIQTQFSNKQPLEATLTDIADGTIAENLVNTANPWADNEVSDTLTVTGYMQDSDIDTFSEIQSWVTDETLLKAGILTDTKYCIWDSANGDIVCNSTPAGSGDVTDVFNCSTGDCKTLTVGTGEYLTYGTGYIDANRFAGVTTVDATEFGYLNGLTAAIVQTGSASHDGFSDYVANEHLDWTADLGATNIHAGNYTDTTANETITLSGDVSGSGTTALTVTVGADKILESHLKAVDAAADEECLTYEATTGDFEWQACGAGGGASTALDNLASVAINTSLLSDTDNTDDLGSSTFEWKDLFIDGIAYVDSLMADIAQLGGATNYINIAAGGIMSFAGTSAIDFGNANEKTGKFLAFDAAESHTLNITGVVGNNPIIRGATLYIEDDPGADANVICRLSFYNSDSVTEDELIKDYYFNLSYTETNGGASATNTTDTVDDISGLVKYDLIRYLGGTAENVRLTAAPTGTTLTFTALANAHADNTGIARIAELTNTFQVYDADSTNEIHMKLEMLSDPGTAVDVVIDLDIQ